MSQQLLKQLCSFKTLQTAADWLQSDSPQPDLDALAAKLESGDYCFQPLTTVQKTNKLGESEILEVWESQDRLVLKAMSLVLKDHLSDKLSTCCHHLEGRGGIKKAVRKTREFVQNNPDSWVLKTDVQGYYAHIDHMVLYNQLQALIPNEDYLLRLTWQFLKRTVYDGGNYYDRELGISLGSPLSPLMAALYLSPLDAEFEGKEWFYARFMDDWVIITPTRWKLNHAVEKVDSILSQCKLDSDKTFIGRSQKGFDFLSYHFTPESLTVGKISLQSRDARIHRLYEQGVDEVRIVEVSSRWQQWAKAGLQDELTKTEEFHNIPRQAASNKLPLEAKFLALGVASVLSTAAFDSHAEIYQVTSGSRSNISRINPLEFCGQPGVNAGVMAYFTTTTSLGAGVNVVFLPLSGTIAFSGTRTNPGAVSKFELGGNASNLNAFNAATREKTFSVTCITCAEPKVLWGRFQSDALVAAGPPTVNYAFGWADSGETIDETTTRGLTDNRFIYANKN